MFGQYNEARDETNTDPCKNPDYKKIKLGRYDLTEGNPPDGLMREFLQIQLHNDPIKLTNQRSSMQVLAFFGAIGGMQRFMGKFFSIVGSYFSAKFFAPKLTRDLYIQKKKKKNNDQAHVMNLQVQKGPKKKISGINK